MALAYFGRFHILIQKNGQKNFLSAMGNSFQYLLSAVHYSDDTRNYNKNLSRAMKAHLERAVKYDQFLKEQLSEYEKGKEFLANMMGNKNRKMTEEEVDEAIEYLFPSRLFVPKSRPLMKPPSKVFPPLKEAEFDYSGRPYHFMFYTVKKNFNQILHDAAKTFETLNLTAAKKKKPPEPVYMAGKNWLSHQELESMCKEKLAPSDYDKFIEILIKITEHPFASEAESFLKKFWTVLESPQEDILPTPLELESGVQVVTIERSCRKTSVAKVSVSCPGTGLIRINNMKLDYFPDISCREQVIFPLVLTKMLGKVDVEATVENGGYSSQAGAVRLGISKALQPLVSHELILRMKLNGLLQRDFRKRERKKPGKEGARRSYTWLKR